MGKKISKRVLQITGSLRLNGLTQVAMNYARNIDKEDLQFDFGIFSYHENALEPEIISRGGNVYRLLEGDNTNFGIFDPIKIGFSTYKILKKNRYQAVHSHEMYVSGIIMFIAWLLKVPVRITHSHNDKASEGGNSSIKKIARYIEKVLVNIFATQKLACSQKAAKFLYGENCFEDKRVKVINNAVDLSKFNYSLKDKKQTNKVIQFIFIGRFAPQKNSLFLVRSFYEMLKMRKDIHLTMIGSGVLESEVKSTIIDLEISEYVTLISPTSEVPQYLARSDFFLLPSLYEGLPVVLVEAQAMGLICFVSDNVTKESDLGLCNFIGIDQGELFWAESVITMIAENTFKKDLDLYKLKMFDISDIANEMKAIYMGY